MNTVLVKINVENISLLLLIPLLIGLGFHSANSQSSLPTITISSKVVGENLDGRMLFLISKDDLVEPRFQIRDNATTAQVFGMDVENWNTSKTIRFDPNSFG